jgi:biotin transport system substrate-specific component
MSLSHSRALLIDALLPVSDHRKIERALFVIVLGNILLVLSAKIQVLFWPVPMTMQTYVVLLLAATYGYRLGLVTIMVYLTEGLFGLPVFATGGGVEYLLRPTGGYLIGFAVATAIVGWLVANNQSLWKVVCAMIIGQVTIYLFGIFYLSTFIGFLQAIERGLLPFVIGDILKLLLAAVTVSVAWHRIERSHR